jgi:hypothetical protein
MMVAAPDGSLKVKNLPALKTQGSEKQNLEGTWKGSDGDYTFELGGAGERKAKIDPSGRLVVTGDAVALVFAPED